MRRYFSNSGPVGFVINIMKFRNFDVINKSDPLAKYLQPLFLSSLDRWQNTRFAISCQSVFEWKRQPFRHCIQERDAPCTGFVWQESIYFLLDCLMLGCCNFLPHPRAPVANPLSSSEEQEYSLALPHSVYFSLIKIQCLLVSRAEDLQIQGIWVRLPSKSDAIDRNRTHLSALSLSNSRRVTWKTFACPQPFTNFWIYHFSAPCVDN